MKYASLSNQSKLMIAFTSAALFLSTTLGCGGPADGRISVTGTVTFDGEPLADGEIVFYKGAGAAGMGGIQDGSFSVQQSAASVGMQPGTYDVAVMSWIVEPGESSPEGEILSIEGESRIPRKYNETTTSGLTAEVSEANSQLTFELLSE